MGGEAIGLDEAARIDEHVDALARRELAGAVLLGDAVGAAGSERDLVFGLELRE
jgi:hypothetical protein